LSGKRRIEKPTREANGTRDDENLKEMHELSGGNQEVEKAWREEL